MAESDSFENCYTCKGIGGSNPPASVKYMSIFFEKPKKEPKNLKEVLTEVKELRANLDKVYQEIEKLKKEQKFSVQKIGIVRFNPFSEVGGDQSFSIALLDGNDSGFIITSLYSRQENRIYGKPVKNGVSEYSLSNEEKEAINKAKGIND